MRQLLLGDALLLPDSLQVGAKCLRYRCHLCLLIHAEALLSRILARIKSTVFILEKDPVLLKSTSAFSSST
jgi:hypothetical protein